MLSIIINFLLAIHVLVALLLVLVVLMQRPKNEGLGAAFGGGMTDNMFGAQTTNVLQTFTRNLGIVFFVLAVTLSVLYAKQSGTVSDVDRKLMDAPKPAAEASPAPEASPAAAAVPAAEETPAVEETPAAPAATEESETVEVEEMAEETVPAVAPEPSEPSEAAEPSPAAATPEETPVGDQ
jgi:preprotein translocase subunit SecG